MSALFNQTNIAPGSAFASGSNSLPTDPVFNTVTADYLTGINFYTSNAVVGNQIPHNATIYNSVYGTTYNSDAEHVFAYQNNNPILSSAARWELRAGPTAGFGYSTGLSGGSLGEFNGTAALFDCPSVSTISAAGGVGNQINIIALVSTLKDVYPGCVG